MTKEKPRRLWFVGFVVLALTLATAGRAHAQGFISPLAGYNFSGDSSCAQVTGCEDKRLNAGVSLGVMNALFGFEEEFAYAKDFFGRAPGFESSVLTLMSNLMIAPAIGPARPYVVGGIGLIKSHVALTPNSVLTSDENNLGWNMGGGLMVDLAPHVGVRGEIRYFRSFDNLNVAGFQLSDTSLDYGRAGAGLVFKW